MANCTSAGTAITRIRRLSRLPNRGENHASLWDENTFLNTYFCDLLSCKSVCHPEMWLCGCMQGWSQRNVKLMEIELLCSSFKQFLYMTALLCECCKLVAIKRPTVVTVILVQGKSLVNEAFVTHISSFCDMLWLSMLCIIPVTGQMM